eukprot:GHUV01016491.1.p1 GENE.GHUV01016491.1~~GHUV01016491.1.p1  ORF type:complete len:441 (+),score=103.72 GHUV01016491.1:747-2069(+)
MAGEAVQTVSARWPGLKNVYALIAYLLLFQAFTGLHPWRLLPKQQARLQQYQQNEAPKAADSYFQPMADLVLPHGYQLEEHFVTTADGYILRMFRIPARPASASAPPASTASTCTNNSSSSACSSSNNNSTHSTAAPVVLMQHALLDTSAGWLLLGPGRGLAFQLADAGFDVWMTNSRGNRYSRNHTRLNPDADASFWSYNVDDLVEYDLPASIQYAKNATGQQQLVYIGYSQGTMIGLAALSSQPDIAASISLAVLMAPVAFTTAMTSPAFVLSAKVRFENYALSIFGGQGEWGSFRQANAEAMLPICRRFPRFCMGYLTAFCGKNPKGNLDPELVPLVFQHLPAGTSVNIMAHWAQGIRRGCKKHLYRFDHGTDCSSSVMSTSNSSRRCNLEVYGQHHPPVYDLAKITTPIALFTGKASHHTSIIWGFELAGICSGDL